MSSLADAPDLVGFFSYSREDDEDSGGKLSKLRERIQAELRGQLGRTKKDFRLWQDKTAIAHGELWEDRIKSAVAESVFFIPIITPTAVKSYHCKFEFDSFLAREKKLDRNNLVFPIVYIPVPALTDDRWHQDSLLAIIGSRQYEQWQNLRHLDPSSAEVALRVEKLCENICKALQQPWLSPQERQETEARQRAEEERRRQEKLQEEARQRAEEERRREEAETKRRLDEAEAEKRRQDKERRELEKEAAWAARKEKLHRWRGPAAVAALLALLMVGGILLYRTTTPVGPTSAVVQPNAPGAEKAKAAAEAEAKRKAEEAALRDTAHDELVIASPSPLPGARVSNLSPALVDRLRLDPSSQGVVIVDTANGSRAQDHGFQPGDLVLSVNNAKIATTRDLERVTGQQSRRWSITIMRGSQQMSVKHEHYCTKDSLEFDCE